MGLHFKKYGEGKKTLVILHGLFGSLDNWQSLGRQFGEHYTTYIVDQRNHGKSPHFDEHTYLAMASDLRIATPEAKTAFLFTRVGLAGCDMGACAILPRIIGQSRAAELLFTGRAMTADEGLNWGFYNSISLKEELAKAATKLAERLVEGPSFGHMMTKTMLAQEWSMSIEQAIEAEAQTQAICMQTGDFERAFKAFVKKEKPVFKGN